MENILVIFVAWTCSCFCLCSDKLTELPGLRMFCETVCALTSGEGRASSQRQGDFLFPTAVRGQVGCKRLKTFEGKGTGCGESLTRRVCAPAGLGWNSRVCISKQSPGPGAADDARARPYAENR